MAIRAPDGANKDQWTFHFLVWCWPWHWITGFRSTLPVVKPSGEVNWWRSELGSLATSTTFSWLGRLATNLGVHNRLARLVRDKSSQPCLAKYFVARSFKLGAATFWIQNQLTRERTSKLNCVLTNALISTIFSCFEDCHPAAVGYQTVAICLECGVQLHQEVAHPLTSLAHYIYV